MNNVQKHNVRTIWILDSSCRFRRGFLSKIYPCLVYRLSWKSILVFYTLFMPVLDQYYASSAVEKASLIAWVSQLISPFWCCVLCRVREEDDCRLNRIYWYNSNAGVLVLCCAWHARKQRICSAAGCSVVEASYDNSLSWIVYWCDVWNWRHCLWIAACNCGCACIPACILDMAIHKDILEFEVLTSSCILCELTLRIFCVSAFLCLCISL
jgi:hypothetical protein